MRASFRAGSCRGCVDEGTGRSAGRQARRRRPQDGARLAPPRAGAARVLQGKLSVDQKRKRAGYLTECLLAVLQGATVEKLAG